MPPAAAWYTFAAQTVTFSGTNPTLTNNLGNTMFQSAVNLAANTTFATPSTISFTGVISGNGSLTKTGGGFLIFTGANTYTGGFTSTTGSVQINNYGNNTNNSAFGTGTFTVTSGITFNILTPATGLAAGALATNNASSWGTGADNIFSAGNLLYLDMGSGAVTLSGTPTWNINQVGTFRFGGVVGGNNGFIKGGTGTLILAGNNTFAGTVALNAGALRIASDANLGNAANPVVFGGGAIQYELGNIADITAGRTVTVNAGGMVIDTNTNNVSFANGVAAGTAGGGLTKNGDGTLTLNSLNSFSGAIVVNRGAIAIGAAGSLGTSTGLSMGSATLSFDPASSGQGFTASTFAGGATISAPFTGGGILALGTLTRSGAGTVNVVLPSAGGGAVTTTQGNNGTIIAGWATVNSTDWAVNDGANNLAALATYQSDFSATTNDVDVPGTAVTPGSATVHSVTVNSVRFNTPGASIVDSNPATPADTLTIATGGILVTPASGAVSISTLNLASSAANGELIINQFNPSAALTISSVIPSGTVTKTGPGAVNLSGVNTFSGLSVEGGSVGFTADVSGNTQLGTGGVTLNGGTLTYNGTAPLPRTASSPSRQRRNDQSHQLRRRWRRGEDYCRRGQSNHRQRRIVPQRHRHSFYQCRPEFRGFMDHQQRQHARTQQWQRRSASWARRRFLSPSTAAANWRSRSPRSTTFS